MIVNISASYLELLVLLEAQMNPVYALQKNNTWWETGEVDNKRLHKRIRSEFTDIIKTLGDNLITNIVGPAGAGKTSLLFDTINQLLTLQTPQKRIIYFCGDDMTIFGEHCSVGSLLEMYATNVLHENLFTFKEPVYVLIDDIQLIDDWQIYLLSYIKRAQKIKFVIAQTYSQGNVLPVGTVTNIPVMPLNQQQFAEFYSAYHTLDIDLLRFKSLLPGVSLFAKPAAYYAELSENVYPLGDYKPYKIKIMDEYLLGGGYPEYFSFTDIGKWQAQLLSAVDLALYRDVGALNAIKSPQKLKRLLYVIAAYGSNEQSFGSIGRTLYVDTSTIISYISALTDGGFAGVAENYSTTSVQEGRVVRKNKRLYLIDTGVYNAVLHNTGITADYSAFVKNAILYLSLGYAKYKGGSVFFWKDGSRNVDIVIRAGDMLLPITICPRREDIGRIVKGLKVFMRCYDTPEAVVITKDVLRREDGIFFIPYWMI